MGLWYPRILILSTYLCLDGEISSTAVLNPDNFSAKQKSAKQEQCDAQRAASGTVLGAYSTTAFQKAACIIQNVLLKVIFLVTIRKRGTNKKKLISKLLKPCSPIFGSYPWFPHRWKAAGVTVLPDHSAHTGSSSLGLDKGTVSPLKPAGFRTMYVSYRAGKKEESGHQEMLANRPYILCRRGYSWLQDKK